MNQLHNNAKESLVRLENAGSVIWSASQKCYYFSKDNVISLLFGDVTNKSLIKYNELNSYQKEQLMGCGIFGDFRVLSYTNDSANKLSYPLEVYFDYSSQCNLRCPGCYNSKHLNNTSFSCDNIQRVIAEMYDLGMMRLHLAGGEPTMDYEKLKVYMTTAKDYGIVTSLATNGTLLSDRVCTLLMNSNMLAVSVSLDGWNDEMNVIRRGGKADNFGIIVDGIKRLVEKKVELAVDTEICLKPTYETKVDAEYFEKMICFSIDLGVDKIKFANPERSLNHESKHYQQEVNRYYENMLSIALLQKKYQDRIKITNITNPVVSCGQIGIPGNKGCIGSQELIAINPDGRITPCLMNDTVLGNYYNYPSLKTFFDESAELKEYRKSIIPNQICGGCEIYLQCRGGCQVRKIVDNGSICGMDPYCPIEAGMKVFNNESFPMSDNFQKINVFHSL